MVNKDEYITQNTTIQYNKQLKYEKNIILLLLL